MDGIKLVFAAIVVSSTALAPVYAKTSDTPAFGIWLAQWAKNAHQTSHERLPCLRADKAACTKAFSSSVAGTRATQRKGTVVPIKRPTHPTLTARRHVVFKNGQRVETTTSQTGSTFQSVGTFARTGRFLVLNDAGSNIFGINLDAPDETQPVQVETLSDFVAEVEQPTSNNEILLADATGGVGDSAFVSLYDFEDEGGAGETQRSPQEITSLLGAQSMLASAAAVPEPGSLLLLGIGLFALRVSRRCAFNRGRLLQPQV